MHCKKLYNLHKMAKPIIALFNFKMDKILCDQLFKISEYDRLLVFEIEKSAIIRLAILCKL